MRALGMDRCFVSRVRHGALAVLAVLALTSPVAPAADADAKATVVVVVGAPGEAEFGEAFAKWAGSWSKAASKAGARLVGIGTDRDASTNDLARLTRALEAEPKDGPADVWLVLIGHGTFDGKEAKFNLTGPDLSATALAAMLKPFKRPVAVLNCASASAPFMAKLAAPGRVVVTATRSGSEVNFARLGQFLGEALLDPGADLDKDGQTSLLEAFLVGCSRVAEFYKGEGRLATEHALLDDNGDGLGTPGDWFRGVRAVRKAADNAPLDGMRAHQFHLVRSEQERKMPADARMKRDALELQVETLRESRKDLGDAEYYKRIEAVLLEIARLYESAK